MNKARLEAFTDAVVAIIITILVLELPKPESYTLASLLHHWPAYLSYAGTFIVILGVWFQHHNLFDRIENINRKVFWANGLWLLIQSFIPFIGAWMSDYPNHSLPFVIFSFLNMFWALSYRLLYITLKEDNKLPNYSWLTTIGYLFTFVVLIVISLFQVQLAILSLIIIIVVVLLMDKDLEID
ncbi:MAG: TMEM175 family protein [Streptococcus sp.]|nr:TMEM175 family protein [Streptococcus sp.]